MKLLSVLKKDLKLLLKDKGQLAVLFLMPLAFIVPVSLSVGPDAWGSMNDDEREPLPVVDRDGGAQALDLIEALDESLLVERNLPRATADRYGLADDPACAQPGSDCDALISEAMLQNGDRIAVLVIPAGFTAAVEAGEKVSTTLRYDPGGDATKRMQLEGVVKGMAIKLSLNKMKGDSFGDFDDMTIYAPDDLKDSIEKHTKLADVADGDQEPAFGVESVSPSNYVLRKLPNTYQQVVPGFTVMFAFFIVGYIHSAFREEKRGGTLVRLLSAPVDRSAILGGKLASALLVGVLQVTVMFAVGALGFGMNLGRDPLALVLLTLAMVAAATGIGLAAAASGLSSGVLIAPLVLGALLGGCLMPRDFLGETIRRIGMIFPQSWALNGYQHLMVRGQGLAQVWVEIVVLLGFALVFFAVAVWRFDFED